MVPHQHLRAQGKRKNVSEGRLYVNWIPTGETLNNVFVEEWKEVGGDSSEEQNTVDAPVHIISNRADELYPKQHKGTSPTQPFRVEGKT